MTDASGKRKRESTDCPYLDTINRSLLDFDLEPSCSVSLESGPHIYSCCVCGKFFRGRGPSTPLYVHAVEESHYVVVHLQTTRFYCLPDDYEIIDSSLNDIAHALNPTYTESIIQNIDTNTTLSRDLFGRRYLPGFVGLNNLNKTDCVNAIVQALAHVPPLRDFFLRQRERQLPASSSSKASLPTIRQALQVTQAFGALIRKIWSHQRFKHHVDPHMLVQAISKASNKKFGAGQQAEVGEMLTFILHQLHLGCGGKIKKKANKSSIVQQTFQGKLRVTTRRKKAMKVIETDITHDDRAGSGDEDESMKQEDAKEQEEIEETTMESHFLQLTLDIPEKPLFRDEDGGLVIPQEPFVNVLKKFDGMTFSEAVHKGMAERKKYELLELPNYLILHLARFNNNRYSREKNPTIVAFPAKNLDLSSYVHGGNVKVPSEEEVRNMSVSTMEQRNIFLVEYIASHNTCLFTLSTTIPDQRIEVSSPKTRPK